MRTSTLFSFAGIGVSQIDKMAPVTKEDFESFEKELAEKITNFSSSEFYPEFVEKLVRRLCVDRKFCLMRSICVKE